MGVVGAPAPLPHLVSPHLTMLSVVIPVYNEELCIDALFHRLTGVMDALGQPYELIFVNDGSRDKSEAKLHACLRKRPDCVRVLSFVRNFGQNTAILAGFEHMAGDIALTLDADMQTPPEEIPTVLGALTIDHDYVGSYRKHRHDPPLRKWVSRVSNHLREKCTGIAIKDQGCMLRAYRKSLVTRIIACQDRYLYISVLAQSLAENPIEVGIVHHARQAGQSAYNYWRLLRLHFDVISGFSIDPLRYITYTGAAFLAVSLVLFSFITLAFLLTETRFLYVLLGLLLIFVSTGILGIGILGEYLGRMMAIAQGRPRYVLKKIKG